MREMWSHLGQPMPTVTGHRQRQNQRAKVQSETAHRQSLSVEDSISSTVFTNDWGGFAMWLGSATPPGSVDSWTCSYNVIVGKPAGVLILTQCPERMPTRSMYLSFFPPKNPNNLSLVTKNKGQIQTGVQSAKHLTSIHQSVWVITDWRDQEDCQVGGD